MSYPAFPSIAIANNMSGKPSDPSLKSEPEDGPVISRAQQTAVKDTFSLSWNALSTADFNTLMTFWKNTVKGGSEICTYTQPVTGTEYEVRIQDLQWKAVKPNRWSVTLTMEEA